MIFGHGVSVRLSGNPIGWLLALSAPIATAYLLILQRRHPRPATQPHRRALMAMLLLQYLVFMTVHIYLGTQRVMYMFHYFLGLVLAFCLVPLVM